MNASNVSIGNRLVIEMGTPTIRQAVQQLCAENFLVFQRVELGMEIGSQHKIWWNHLQQEEDICEMAPRDHGKSQSLARAYPIWRIKYDKWTKQVLILGADQPSAVENLDKIKDLIGSSISLRYLIPTKRRDTFFSRTEILLSNGKSMKAKGIGSPLRGRHPQLIVLDDVLNEDNSLSPEHQDRMRRYFNEVIVPMKDKGLDWQRKQGFRSKIVVVGTAQDRNDLYHELQANQEYVGAKLKAITDDEHKSVLWPERYSYPDLIKLKGKIGAVSFSKEYQNEPLSDDTSPFPPSLFDPLKDKSLSYVRSYEGMNPVFMGVDFSVPGSQDGDWTVIYVFEFDPQYKSITPLMYERFRPREMQEQIHRIELMCNTYKVTLGYLEDNLFQGVYANLFKHRSALPLSGHTVTHGKKMSLEFGLLSFRPQFENGVWRFPYKTPLDQAKTDEMVLEFGGIRARRGKIGNEGYHDDIVMSMWHAVSASRAAATFAVDWG